MVDFEAIPYISLYDKFYIMSILIALFVAVLSISFLCSILESILLSVNPTYISVLSSKNPKAGKALGELKKNIDKSISSILILNTITNTFGATSIGIQASVVFSGNSVAIIFTSIILTFLILFIAEIIPKTIGAVYWKHLTVPATKIINVFIIITYPIIKITSFVTRKINKQGTKNSITKEEIIHTALLSDEINNMESDIIENTLALQKTKVQDILTPRSVVFAIDINSKIKDVLLNEKLYKFSRIPVYKDSIDNIIGVVLSKKIFKMASENKNINIETMMDKIENINENLPVSKVLSSFVKAKSHMAVVVDGYDQTEGIVTLEDCIETLLGLEIMDELDTTEDMRKLASKNMKKRRNEKGS